MLLGNYWIEDDELERGATYVRYHARHRVMPRQAIVKVMAEVGTIAEGYVAVHLLREACLMAALQHAGVPAIYESGLSPDRRPWFAMESVAGPSLAELLALGPIDRHQAIVLIRDLAEVLDHAHARGVVHGGLRPDQIVLTNRPHGFTLCVTDWSTARAHDAAPIPYTPTLESWHYTAPELVHGDVADDRADTFSLGVIAHQLMTGQPFARGSATELDVASLPPDVIALIDAMVAEPAADRPSCRDVQRQAAELVDVSTLLAPPTQFRIRKPRWTPDNIYRLTADRIGVDAFEEDEDG